MQKMSRLGSCRVNTSDRPDFWIGFFGSAKWPMVVAADEDLRLLSVLTVLKTKGGTDTLD